MTNENESTAVRSIRLTKEEFEEAIFKGKTYGVRGLSAVVRIALKKLRPLEK